MSKTVISKYANKLKKRTRRIDNNLHIFGIRINYENTISICCLHVYTNSFHSYFYFHFHLFLFVCLLILLCVCMCSAWCHRDQWCKFCRCIVSTAKHITQIFKNMNATPCPFNSFITSQWNLDLRMHTLAWCYDTYKCIEFTPLQHLLTLHQSLSLSFKFARVKGEHTLR